MSDETPAADPAPDLDKTPDAPPSGRRFAAVAIAAIAVVGAVIAITITVAHRGHRDGLSDEETRTQVVDAAGAVVRSAGLQQVSGQFFFRSCADDDAAEPDPNAGPPYNGQVDMSFAVPADVDPAEYLRRISVMLAVHGWQTTMPPPGDDTWIAHKGGVAAALSATPGDARRARAVVFGECRNWGEHAGAEGTDVTGQLW
ncbi:hypothetical protein [Mycobacterium sp. 1274756.6]|uniref:hypothetical protein n=1 Tax=Mycobacterium sp. 1274756.6 TaxID=1834076 RepID=UPI0007FED4A8|nr:hypothetical protein [Mycobacterium sp. 1274756.6]OBJ71027.1 hypothetical protein A5643_09075 [Mycobacterium sp. 1274756.6]